MAPEARLASGIWIAAYRARLEQAGIPAYVTRRGDDTAGAVLVKCARLDGRAQIWAREWDMDTDRRAWRMIFDGDEAGADAAAARQAGFDPDLWVIEIESREGRTLLDEDGLA